MKTRTYLERIGGEWVKVTVLPAADYTTEAYVKPGVVNKKDVLPEEFDDEDTDRFDRLTIIDIEE